MNSLPMSGATALIARLRRPLLLPLLAFALLMAVMPEALAHGVPEGDKGFIQESTGVMLMPFIYMGAKHMVIHPFLVLTRSRGQAARANFCLGVMPPRAIFGRS